MVAGGCAGSGGMRTEDSQGRETMVYETITVDTCHYTLVKAHRMDTTKSGPSCDLGLGQVYYLQQMYHSAGNVDRGVGCTRGKL